MPRGRPGTSTRCGISKRPSSSGTRSSTHGCGAASTTAVPARPARISEAKSHTTGSTTRSGRPADSRHERSAAGRRAPRRVARVDLRLVALLEAKDLLEPRWAGGGGALLEQLGHRVLPARRHFLLFEPACRRLEVVGLEVAEHLAPVPEDRVVPDAGFAERSEHLRPDLPMRPDVLVDPLRAHVQDERAALCHHSSSRMQTTRLRGPWTPSTRFSSMSDVADGPETNVSGRRSRPRSTANAHGTVSTF